MEFVIDKESFDKAISDVSRAVSLNTPFPILTGIKMVVNKSCLILIGSNSNIVIEKIVPLSINGKKVLEVVNTGSLVVPAKYLNEIVKKLSNDIHLIVSGKQRLTISSANIVTNLNGFDSQEYPSLPETEQTENVNISSQALMEVIKQTAYAVSMSEHRPVLTGINMSFNQGKLTCVATDSSRLALSEVKIDSVMSGSVNVPSASLKELFKLMDGDPGEVDMLFTKSHVVFRKNSITLFSRLIVGKYPNVTDLIPKESNTIVTLNTNQLLRGVDRACLFAGEWKNNNITLEIKESSKLKIISSSSEIGEIEEIQNISHLIGQTELSITLDGKFLLDVLKVIKEEEINITYNGPMKPLLIQPLNNASHLHLISPVRTY